jgi:hypothetical protein
MMPALPVKVVSSVERHNSSKGCLCHWQNERGAECKHRSEMARNRVHSSCRAGATSGPGGLSTPAPFTAAFAQTSLAMEPSYMMRPNLTSAKVDCCAADSTERSSRKRNSRLPKAEAGERGLPGARLNPECGQPRMLVASTLSHSVGRARGSVHALWEIVIHGTAKWTRTTGS